MSSFQRRESNARTAATSPSLIALKTSAAVALFSPAANDKQIPRINSRFIKSASLLDERGHARVPRTHFSGTQRTQVLAIADEHRPHRFMCGRDVLEPLCEQPRAPLLSRAIPLRLKMPTMLIENSCANYYRKGPHA